MTGTARLRLVVDRADAPACGVAIGDAVEIDGTNLITDGKSFCPLLLASVIPVLASCGMDLPHDDWLVRKPYMCCPRAEENVVVRIDGIVGQQSCA